MKDLDFFNPGARLALELECLLLDTRNDAVQSRWWDSAHEALEQWRQAVRAMEASIDAVQPEASTTLEQAGDHAHICSKLAEQYKSDPVLFAALTDAAAIIRDLMRDRLGASATGDAAGYARGLKEAGQDAERYRWLRRHFAIVGTNNGAVFHALNLPTPTHIAPYAAIELDASIDAALREEVKP